MVFKKRPSNY